MPFPHCIIGQSDDMRFLQKVSTPSDWRLSPEEAANRSIVCALRQLSQLVQIADDVFRGISQDCKIVEQRTENLRIKVWRCLDVVEQQNAKSVPVPVSTLSAERQRTGVWFRSRRDSDVLLFSADRWPPAVRRLYRSANGPTPLVAEAFRLDSETDGRSESSCHSRASPAFFPTSAVSGEDKIASSLKPTYSREAKNGSECKEDPSVVPVDVSGHTFRRMASFRRSLIQMDFLTRRRKKKDKRRNTVAEGGTQELQQALSKMAVGNDITSSSHVRSSENANDASQNTIQSVALENTRVTSEENNNYEKNALSFPGKTLEEHYLSPSLETTAKDTNRPNTSDSFAISKRSPDRRVCKVKRNGTSPNETLVFSAENKKSRSFIPISTLSAAMAMAVKMRQTPDNSKLDDSRSSSGHWSGSSGRTSSDSDTAKSETFRNETSFESKQSVDSLLGDNSTVTVEKRYADEKAISSNNSEHLCKEDISNKNELTVDTDTENSESSSSHGVHIDSKYFSESECIGAFDSDDCSELSYSSVSFGSNGSLNSLLSRAATEVTSSTSTLTSKISIPSTPPPKNVDANGNCSKVLENSTVPTRVTHVRIPFRTTSSSSCDIKTVLQPKQTKVVNHYDVPRTSNRHKNVKSVFSNLIPKKFRSKQRNSTKLANFDKQRKTENPLVLNMYGDCVANDVQPLSSFVKVGYSYESEQRKSPLYSFCPNNTPKGVKPCCIPEIPNWKTKEKCIKESSVMTTSTSAKCNLENQENFSQNKVSTLVEGQPLPMKYAHHITITPLKRPEVNENNKLYKRTGIYFQNRPYNDNMHYVSLKNTYNQNIQNANHNAEKRSKSEKFQHTYSSEKSSLQPNVKTSVRHVTTQNANVKSAAHVVLNPNGEVIYSTSSLDRRQYNRNSPPAYLSNNSILSDSYFQDSEFHSNFCNGRDRFSVNLVDFKQILPQANIKTCNPTINNKQFQRLNRFNEHNMQSFKPQMKNNVAVTEIINANRVSFPSHEFTESAFQSNFQHKTANNIRQMFKSAHINEVPDSPDFNNCQYLLTKENLNLHSQNMNDYFSNSSTDSRFPTSSLYSNEMNDSNFSDTSDIQSQKSSYDLTKNMLAAKKATMNAEELFAFIHDSKKRLNIKTETDISATPSSSRSSSPSYFRQLSTPTKSGVAETGFLTPRASISQGTVGDRRSWAGFIRSPSTFTERPSLASDRMGPSKPTSMHDFKMLLLQARTTSHIGGQRKSAAELLQISNYSGIRKVHPEPSEKCVRGETFTHPHNSTVIYDGHSTFPMKRGSRARNILQQRHIMYPPIFEEVEHSSEVQESCATKCLTQFPDTSDNDPLRQRHVLFNENKPKYESQSLWV